MIIYILNLVSVLFYAFVFSVSKKKYNSKKFLVVLLTAQLITILALRNSTVGVDIPGYVRFFQNTPILNFQQFMAHRWELGFKLLNKAISLFTSNEQVFLTIIATLTIIPVGRFIYKYSKMPFLSFALYISFNFYSFVFSGLRQGIAYGIVLISYDFIVNRKLSKFIICILFASLFHRSALIFLPAYFLVKFKINYKSLGIVVITNGILYLFRKQIFEFAIQQFYPSYEVVVSSSISWMILGIIITILGLLFYKNVVGISSQNNDLYVIMITGVSLMIFATVGTNVMRMADYYYLFIIIFIPEVMNSIKDKGLVMLGGYLVVISTLVLHLWFLTYADTYQMVPYIFFWK